MTLEEVSFMLVRKRSVPPLKISRRPLPEGSGSYIPAGKDVSVTDQQVMLGWRSVGDTKPTLKKKKQWMKAVILYEHYHTQTLHHVGGGRYSMFAFTLR